MIPRIVRGREYELFLNLLVEEADEITEGLAANDKNKIMWAAVKMQLGAMKAWQNEEEAFYEILAKHKTAISDFDLIKEIVKEITASIKKNLQIDWFKKPDARAQVMLAVRRVL